MKFTLYYQYGFIFNCIGLIVFLQECQANQATNLILLADHLFDNACYESSITEYKRFLFFHANHEKKFYAYYKIGLANKNCNKWNKAIRSIRKALQNTTAQNYRDKIRFQLAMLYMEKKKWNQAQTELFKLIQKSSSPNIILTSQLFQGIIFINKSQWKKAIETFQKLRTTQEADTLFKKTLIKIENILEYTRQNSSKKSPKLAQWLSTFIPGSGQLYAQHTIDGINALGLNVTNSYILWHQIRTNQGVDAALIFFLLWLRYYIGNRMHAKEAAINYNITCIDYYISSIYKELLTLSRYLPEETSYIKWQEIK